MAHIFKRGENYWVKFRNPTGREELRVSLETRQESEALCMLRKITLLCELRRPAVVMTTLPARLAEVLDSRPAPQAPPPAPPAPSEVESAPPTPVVAAPAGIERLSVKRAVQEYNDFIQTGNERATVANKLSIFRKFFGSNFMLEITGAPPKRAEHHDPYFTGEWMDEISVGFVQKFIEAKVSVVKTRRHYRELFHHLFETCLKRQLLEPKSWHSPNPMSALPGYLKRNHTVVFMNAEQIDEQDAVLEDHPVLQMAVRTMIESGLRREELLWLTRDSVSPNFDYLSVVNRLDDEDIESNSLKTGARSVTISPRLREALQVYLPTLTGRWLFPSPKGKRWDKDNFSRALRTANAAKKLKWGPLIYRHTFATRRAMIDGWSAVRLTREMGNSVAVVDQYYAGFFRPDALTSS